ncbi:3-oxoacyl-ACP synthase [Gemmobacter aquaticus]|uniref:3-oxoacyl-ACP synthase n=1 Tax=Gemmobacter aquaticus TaxID=490185 RepID=A0A917YMU7_9RHOB|nr:3-oxoacyl-ACP synthase [Gemmobacter aquaticus]GGO36884.1 3-oxoacyl-ACP synthase [Gemmobacter aquaticus]
MADAAPAIGTCPGLSVIGYGIWSALGPDGPSTVAGLRTRMIASETGALWDATGDAGLPLFRVAAHQWWTGPDFLPELAVPVIEECLAQVGALPPALRRRTAEVPILVAAPPRHRPTSPPDPEARLLAGIERRLGRPLPPGSGVIAAGRVGLPHLVARASAQIDRYPLQILVGVESFIRQGLVDTYLAQGRLFCAANSSGFIPGEAAAALLVMRSGARNGPELAITGMGAGQEPGRDGGSREAAVTGAGLTTAMRAAVTASGRDFFDIPCLLGDLNGEHFKFKEAAIATMRIDRAPPEGASRRPRGYAEHWNVIEGLGEIGAALMPVQLGWAFEAGRQGRLPQGRALAFAGEDDGARVAMTLEMRGGPV